MLLIHISASEQWLEIAEALSVRAFIKEVLNASSAVDCRVPLSLLLLLIVVIKQAKISGNTKSICSVLHPRKLRYCSEDYTLKRSKRKTHTLRNFCSNTETAASDIPTMHQPSTVEFTRTEQTLNQSSSCDCKPQHKLLQSKEPLSRSRNN